MPFFDEFRIAKITTSQGRFLPSVGSPLPRTAMAASLEYSVLVVQGAFSLISSTPIDGITP
jgi:hypothetical protein